METGIPWLTFAQLFSFQVLYDKEEGGLSGKKWRRAIFEVDFSARTVQLQEKERPIESQPFSAYDKYFKADPENSLVSIFFEGDLWQLFTQNAAEKSCIEHLLQCARKEISAEEAISLGHGIIGLDRSIMKYGFIQRKATTRSKKDKRFLVLVPGKLFMFKGKDITNRHARYVSSLLGATVRVVDSLLEFQLFSPNSSAITFIALDTEDLASWLELLEKSIQSADCGKWYSIMPDTATNCSKAGTDFPFSSRSKEDQFRPLQLVGREDYAGDKCKKQEKKGLKDVDERRQSSNSMGAPRDAEGGRHRLSQGMSREKLSQGDIYDFYNPYDDEEKKTMDAFYYTNGLGRNERRRKGRRHRLSGRRAEAYAYYGGSIETGNEACEAVPKMYRIRPNLADEAQCDFYEEQYVNGRRHRGNTGEFAEEQDGWTSAPVGSVAYYRSSYRGGMRKMKENETSTKQRDLCTYQGRRLLRGSGNEGDEPGPLGCRDDYKSECFVEDGFVSAERMRKKSSFDGLSRYRAERHHNRTRMTSQDGEWYPKWKALDWSNKCDYYGSGYNTRKQMEENLSAWDWSNKRDHYGSGYNTRKQAKDFEQGVSFVEGILAAESSAVDLARRASRRFYN